MFKIDERTRILIVSPHPDDESIGMGGFLMLYGQFCDVLLLTDGSAGKKEADMNDFEYKEIRKKEFLTACSLAKVRKTFFANVKDKELYKNRRSIFELDINLKEYQYVFIPNKYESHIDHMAVYPIMKKFIRKKKSKAILVEYEVWTPIQKPDFYLDITEVVQSKKRMIDIYKSQNKYCDFVEKSVSLNSYRGMQASMIYAEAYSYAKEKYKERIKHIIPFRLYMFIRRTK